MKVPGWAPVLTDGTVTLRAHRPEDVDAVLEHCRDPLMQRWTTVPSPYEREHAERYIAEREQRWNAREELGFAVVSEDRFAGSFDLRPRGDVAAEVGYGVAPWARGRGVASRALRLLLGWAFGPLDLQTVLWRAEVGNWASRRLAWSVGVQVLGAVPGLLEHKGRSVDGWIGWVQRGEPLAPRRPWLEPARLQGGGVHLRAHSDEDVAAIVQACRDAESTHWLPLPTPYTEADARRYQADARAHEAAGEAVHWVIADPSDNHYLGHISVFRMQPASRSGEIGYLSHPDARRRGVMTGALRLVVRHALTPVEDGGLGLSRVQVRTAAGNAASQRVAVNAGFHRTGIDRCALVLSDGTVCDEARFDLLAEELPASHPAHRDG